MVVQESFPHREGMTVPLKNDKKHRLKQRFDVHKKLGQGTYGKVQLAINKETGQEVAIKTIKKVKIESEQDLIRIRREIQIMSSIQHPHIIHIYEVFENKDKIVLVMQFASGGELYDYLSEKKVLSDTEARRIFRQIAAAIYYCHKNKICHRDLKLENILLDEKGNAKIADFGLSNVFDERHLLTTYCGSPLYASPEIVKGVPYYGPEVDCWSMGVLLYTLVYGAMPFDGSNFKKLVTQISEGDYFEPKKKSKASTLIHKLLTVNPAKRATIVDICTDWWVNQGYEHSLLQVAEDMANLTPVRLDLLLALSPVSPVPPEEAAFQEQQTLENFDNLAHDGLVPEGNVHDEEEEEEDDDEEEEDNPETAVNSFAYVKGSHASNLSASSPNLQHVDDRLYDEDNEFLPADIAAALQNQCVKRAAEKSFDGSLVRISSLAHQSKKPRKSESSQIAPAHKEIQQAHIDKPAVSNESFQEKHDDENSNVLKENLGITENISKLTVQDKSETIFNGSDSSQKEKVLSELEKSNKSIHKEDVKEKGNNWEAQKSSTDDLKHHDKSSKQPASEAHMQNNQKTDSTENDLACSINQVETNVSKKTAQRTGSFTTLDNDALTSESKKAGRCPGKITIPKSFDSQQQSPSPKAQVVKKITIDKLKSTEETCSNKIESKQKYDQTGILHEQEDSETSQNIPTGNAQSKKEDAEDKKKVLEESFTDSKINMKSEAVCEEKKVFAKGILKKGIAKAKLAERKMSQQSSFESEITTPSSPSIGTPETTGPSFFKTPKPYFKENDHQVESKAEIVLTPPISKHMENSKRDEIANNRNESIWDAPPTTISSERQLKLLKNKNLDWRALSSTLDSEMSDWREQMEESLRRLSPDEDEEKSTSSQSCVIKSEDDKPLVPIARSYKKFTFTKDGACITETKKIYETPGADGSWTKVEKKTKITTRPGNAEEFEKFRDLHLRNDSPLARSDSQSSSGSTDIFDDIFDSWTGDSMLCNMMKMKNVFHKFSRDPFLRKERRRNPFRQFQRTESERNERIKKRSELKSGHSTDKESSDNEEDYDVHFDGSNPVVYGSQGLWQLLRSANKGFPGHITVSHHQPFEKLNYSRSVSQERPESKLDNWKRSESRASSGYNTGTRSQSRDRTESPREKVLRFVFESPKQRTPKVLHSGSPPSRLESWSFKRSSSHRNPRRDSGVGSDGYESEHSIPHTPSDELLKTGTVSPLTSVYGTSRPDIFQSFMKSWSKDGPSTSLFPSSLQEDSPDEQSENLAESRRHRVEQWLHMSDIKNPGFPLDFSNDNPHAKTSAMRSPNVMRNDHSSLYGTMRPREYMKYNRSVSDKMPDYDLDYFPTFEDSQRSRSIHNLHNKEQGFEGDGSKVRARAAVYSPVSEESSREAQSLYRSDSSHSASSVHRINFTISDGRISSSHTPAHSSTRYVKSFSGSSDGQSASGKSSGNINVEQVPTRVIGQPVVQMRVSFNRGSRDNQVIHVTSQPQQQMSKGLWQQQEHEISRPVVRQDFSNPNREDSPLPGIRKFSTEMVHPVSSVSELHDATVTSEARRARHISAEKPTRTTSLEYEISNTAKDAIGISKRGKNSPFTSSSVLDENPLNACSLSCMDPTMKITNPNNQTCSQSTVCAGVCPERLAKELRTMQCLKEIVSDDHVNSEDTTKDYFSNGANTPDSLEESCGKQNMRENEFTEDRYKKKSNVQTHCGADYSSKIFSNTTSPCDNFHLEIKPLGVLWDSCKQNLVHGMKQEEESKTNFSNDHCKSKNEKPQDSILETFSVVENITESYSANRNSKLLNTRNNNEWTHKETNETFDLLKKLPGESSLNSTRYLLKSSPFSITQNETASEQVISFQDSSHKISSLKSCSLPQSVFDDRISLICEFENEEKHSDRFQRMLPTLMDDLRSPKEVLRQAMRLCDSFNS